MPVVYLVGFMGCGKTAVGEAMSAILGVRFIDLDAELAERFQVPVNRIFACYGERVFRREEAHLLATIRTLERAVVATGAGTYCSPSNRRLIESSGGISVYLNAPWKTLRERLPTKGLDRPPLSDPEQAEALFLLRDPTYRQARVAVAVAAGAPPIEVARSVVSTLVEESLIGP